METKVTAKENQHEILRSLLLEAGWLDVKLWIFPLGTLGAIHSLSLSNLVALGLTRAAAAKLLAKLSRYAVHAAQAISARKGNSNGSCGATLSDMRAGRALVRPAVIVCCAFLRCMHRYSG